MPRFEKRLVRFFEAHILKVGLFLLLAASVVVRYKLMPFYTNDMISFLLPWVDGFRADGFAALGAGVGNYNILYLLVLYAISVFPAGDEGTMLAIKAVSLVFDYLMAVGVGMVVYQASATRSPKQRYHWACLAFGTATLLPMVLLNSALWGQCDSIFACFSIWSVYMLLREKYVGAFLLFGLAFCFKLQAIFLLPVFIILYVVQKKFSLFLFALPPVMLFLASLPAIAVGANWAVGFEIYFVGQVTEYEYIFVDYPSLAALIQDERYEFFSTGLTVLAILVCFVMLALLVVQKLKVTGFDVLALAAWSVYACVLFLPSMHERYAYVGEVLVWAAFLARPGKRTLIPAVVFTFAGYCSYAGFLFHFQPVPFQYLALACLATFGYMTFSFFTGLTDENLPRPARRRRAVRETILEIPVPVPAKGAPQPGEAPEPAPASTAKAAPPPAPSPAAKPAPKPGPRPLPAAQEDELLQPEDILGTRRVYRAGQDEGEKP